MLYGAYNFTKVCFSICNFLIFYLLKSLQTNEDLPLTSFLGEDYGTSFGTEYEKSPLHPRGRGLGEGSHFSIMC